MTWISLHKYGEGVFQLVDGGVRRPPTADEARAIALELERFADTSEPLVVTAPILQEFRNALTRDATPLPDSTAGYLLAVAGLADPDVDVALFANKTHDVVAVFQAAGGSRLRCLACRLEGQRLYQDSEAAQAYARMLSGVRVPAWPRCTPRSNP